MNFLVSSLQKIPATALVCLAAVSVVIGDIFAKYWSLNTKGIFYGLAILFYMGSAILYMPSLLKEGLVLTSMLWILISTLGLLFVGLVMFHEPLSATKIVGVALGIVALVILTFAK